MRSSASLSPSHRATRAYISASSVGRLARRQPNRSRSGVLDFECACRDAEALHREARALRVEHIPDRAEVDPQLVARGLDKRVAAVLLLVVDDVRVQVLDVL